MVSLGLGSVITAAVASIFLMVLNGRQPDSLPLFFVTFLAMWVIWLLAILIVNRLIQAMAAAGMDGSLGSFA
ncbi:hypothetical protein [Arthrobacter sp. QXT-31]|uniref:hypothetical protein n=1 Tax=Arthrobacter sp. QXT-31 TaxID=1357915 RepID=UPI000971857E|nr:hypothetical protein [Arthrobacter sp. QXT-31]APX03961.1 hypothetical protein BWQ92_21550 [Arthrobacter sp. QXT-31]